jgi:hypothetical protein
MRRCSNRAANILEFLAELLHVPVIKDERRRRL